MESAAPSRHEKLMECFWKGSDAGKGMASAAPTTPPIWKVGLLDGAAHHRKDVIGIRSNQPNRAHNNGQDHAQHHCVLGDILAFFIKPESA